MNAPEKYAEWMSAHEHVGKQCGHVYRYHSRSDAHSIALCRFVLEDLLTESREVREQAIAGVVGFGINIRHTWPNGKTKTIDLAIGRLGTSTGRKIGAIAECTSLSEVYISCEAKSVMTEHGKSQPRVYDELGSSHEIVHQGNPRAIAAGIAVVNIAERFASPLRQRAGTPIQFSLHKQPHVAERMIQHLRGLPVRESVNETGFDAYCTIVISCDNVGRALLYTGPPAPQPGDPDSYAVFIRRLVRAYGERFSSVR